MGRSLNRLHLEYWTGPDDGAGPDRGAGRGLNRAFLGGHPLREEERGQAEEVETALSVSQLTQLAFTLTPHNSISNRTEPWPAPHGPPRVPALPLTAHPGEIERLKEQLETGQETRGMTEPLCPGVDEVARLRTSVAEQARAQAAGDVLCRSLAEEAHRLRRTLAATANMCQQLARCLEERQQVGQGEGGESGPQPPAPSGDTVELATLREENRLLKEKVAYVEDLNARWQRYDASRDEYVRGLQAQLGGSQALHPLEGPPKTVLLRKEIARLNQQLEETLGECMEARRQLVATREARDAALERGQVLEQQAPWPPCRNLGLGVGGPWLCGHLEAEALAGGRWQSQKALSGQAEAHAMVTRSAGGVPCRSSDIWEPGHTVPESRAPQHLEMDAPEPGCQKLVSTKLEPPAESRSAGTDLKNQGDLQCPHCLQRFHDELGEELLRHVDECCQ
ncbi:PREDICTED: TNFAIP3-interacting protein 2 [Elephantulus edwardii]|uniref:TNFAIP3-interacting protein 2 n=1 Tax=Elephantulus edwardii TaxID=28737 RepID=UPI0003F084E6|nr:PREDICTED: TNFAIP3-interacting protein 2 [Elephantulus edwardii]